MQGGFVMLHILVIRYSATISALTSDDCGERKRTSVINWGHIKEACSLFKTFNDRCPGLSDPNDKVTSGKDLKSSGSFLDKLFSSV
ncbi:unnamed protein product [Adineta ricciae]|uniref:Uncharacterized protein n=1 Tax=Adineta ricciae TaxID=249248 RepID=A0A814ZSH7_ADIRI|nr:unnamed protein product [Adineta ricciae]CAF1419913.1 unnamed protein product [Adineta ricciae]